MSMPIILSNLLVTLDEVGTLLLELRSRLCRDDGTIDSPSGGCLERWTLDSQKTTLRLTNADAEATLRDLQDITTKLQQRSV